MVDEELERIEVSGNTVFPKWMDDPFTFQPMYNPDGTRKRGLLSVVDYNENGTLNEDTRETMEVHDSGPGWVLVKRGGRAK